MTIRRIGGTGRRLAGFLAGEKVPEVNFSKHLVVFSRNVTFYNRIGIVKALLRDGVAEILVMQTRSALPIEARVAMALAVISRIGVKYIKAGKDRIPVTEDAHGLASGPLNATYIIEGNEITLQNGRSEVAAERMRCCLATGSPQGISQSATALSSLSMPHVGPMSRWAPRRRLTGVYT